MSEVPLKNVPMRMALEVKQGESNPRTLKFGGGGARRAGPVTVGHPPI